MSEEMNIPDNWISVSIEDVVFSQKGKKPKKLQTNEFQGSKPYLDIKAFEHGEIRQYAETESSNIVDEDDIVIVWDGARSGWVSKGKKGALGSTLARLKPFLFSQSYLYYFLNSKFLYINNNTKGTGIPHVDPLILWGIKMPFPPLNEQNRIVAQIEELFSDLDNGIQNLKLAHNQLKVYRQALLKHAFEGKLTEQWRKENNPEPAEKLLVRIKEERQKRYEQELADWKKAVKEYEKDGKKGKKPSKPRFKPELSTVEDEDNSIKIEFKSWLKQNLNNIAYLITDGKHGDCENEDNSGYYFLSAKDVNNGRLNYDNARQINYPEFQEVHNRTNLAPGDICLVNTGATVGKIAIAPDDEKTYQTTFQKSVAIIKVFNAIVLTEYLTYLLIEKNRKLLSTSKGTAVNNLLLKDIRSFLIPLPSMLEQQKIVQELGAQFSIIDKLEQTIENSLRKSEALRQSILKKAFEGKLVEQDLNDEPANELLKRIKEEKEKYLAEQKELKKEATKNIKKMSKNLSIEEVLKTSDKPMLAKEVWQQSKHKNNIEEFYAELKKIQESVKEVKKGTESILSLAK